MALTKVTGHVIKSDTNITSHNINSSGIVTAITFDGNVSGVAVTFTGDSTIGSLGITTNLTVGGISTFTGNIDANGDLDVDGHTNLDNVSIAGVTTVTGEIKIPDLSGSSNKISLGTNQNLQIFHNGTNAYLLESTNAIVYRSAIHSFRNSADSEQLAQFNQNGAVKLYFDNTKRLETTNTGAIVSGILTVTGNMNVEGVLTYQDVTNIDSVGIITARSNIDCNGSLDVDGHTDLDNVSISGVTTATGNITISSSHPKLLLIDDTNPDFSVHVNATAFHIRNETDNRNEFRILSDGTTELHYAGTKKFETGNTVNTNSNHFEITSGQQLRFDNSNDNRSSEILNTGSSGNSTLAFKTNGGTRWTIDSSGHIIPGTAGAVNIGSASAEIGNVYIADSKNVYFGSDQDAEIYHNGSSLYMNNATGNFYVRSSGGQILINPSNSYNAIVAKTNEVELYYNQQNHSTPKLSTTATGITVGGEVAATQDYPDLRPRLDFNFAAEKKLDPRIVYYRTGPASFTDELGKVVLVGDNTPRFDHDPLTGESKGLLMEITRTNLLPYSIPDSNWNLSHATMTENAGIAPDGTNTAVLHSDTNTNNQHLMYAGSITISNATNYVITSYSGYTSNAYII